MSSLPVESELEDEKISVFYVALVFTVKLEI